MLLNFKKRWIKDGREIEESRVSGIFTWKIQHCHKAKEGGDLKGV
jgi:hypothetical protein